LAGGVSRNPLQYLDILRKHDVKRASLFGSVVRGEATEDSDIDLLVEFEGRKSLLDLV
jgi:predicted nucleotidyltransferase